MQPLSFRAKFQLDKSLFFYLLRYDDPDQNPMHFIFAIRGDKAEAFQAAIASRPLKLDEWGSIISAGDGYNPSPETLLEIQELFGLNIDFSKDNFIHLEEQIRVGDEQLFQQSHSTEDEN